jgi:DNA-binding MarR family transcriptional regulator
MPQDREEALTLELLNAIEARSDVTQRHLADRLGVALGLANSYLKRCVRKGLVKVTQAPANRYLYYLTPQGFVEKSRLTRDYLAASLDFYRRASDSMVRALEDCQARGAQRVVLAGVSELAEIASIRAHDLALEVLGTYDPQSGRQSFVGRPVWFAVAELPDCDAAILTALGNPAEVRRDLGARFEDARILVPDLVEPLLAREDGRVPAPSVAGSTGLH